MFLSDNRSWLFFFFSSRKSFFSLILVPFLMFFKVYTHHRVNFEEVCCGGGFRGDRAPHERTSLEIWPLNLAIWWKGSKNSISFFQYFMKKLGGKSPEKDKCEKTIIIRVQFMCFIFNFFPPFIIKWGLFCKINTPDVLYFLQFLFLLNWMRLFHKLLPFVSFLCYKFEWICFYPPWAVRNFSLFQF